MKLSSSAHKQLECAISELNELESRLGALKGAVAVKNLRIVLEYVELCNGNLELARGWIERVQRGEKLAKISK